MINKRIFLSLALLTLGISTVSANQPPTEVWSIKKFSAFIPTSEQVSGYAKTAFEVAEKNKYNALYITAAIAVIYGAYKLYGCVNTSKTVK